MKAVILAGGSGTRLYPTTQVVNKLLLPIYNKPMIYYPLSLVMLAGIREILMVVNPEDLESFKRLPQDGSHLGISISYATQNKPKGLAHAFMVTEAIVQEDSVCLVLGDNLFFGHGLPEIIKEAKKDIGENKGAYIFGYYVPDSQRFGIAEFDSQGNVIALEEKPKNPKSNYAVVGLYFYDSTVFEKAKKIKPSHRGEYEITSVNEEYLKENSLRIKLLGREFAWFDAGTNDSFLEAGEFVATIEKKTGLMIGCIEEIAYRNGWIDRDALLRLAKPLSKTLYGKYLIKLADE